MTPNSKIYVDIDDVLCETGRAFVALLRQEFGKNIRFEDISDFDLGASFGLAPDDLERFMQQAHAPEILLSMRAVEGASATITQWRQSGSEVHVVTGRPVATRDISRRWLNEFDIPFDQLIFVDKYSRHTAGTGDDDVMTLAGLKECRYDLAIEDAPEMARLLSIDVADHVLLYDRPWNRNETEMGRADGNGITRCLSWDEIAFLYPDGSPPGTVANPH
jgi:uncharacterized HAD superfamily protein